MVLVLNSSNVEQLECIRRYSQTLWLRPCYSPDVIFNDPFEVTLFLGL